ncbi:MAG: ROK family protein [Eubacterium sp.]
MYKEETLTNIRNKNLSDILRVLRKKGPCSLAQLTENIDGGLTTVKKCVMQAAGYGMIKEGDTELSTGGRKAKLYLINKEYQYFLFLIIDNDNLYCKIYDFCFETVEEYSLHFKMDECLDCMYQSIDDAVKKYCLGTVCMSLPCVIKNGTIVDWYYNISAVGTNVKKEIENKYAVNVIVQNDMNLTVMGENVKNRAVTGNIATVQLGHNGFGVGEMVNGHLLEGNNGFAGEVGYTNDKLKSITGISFPAKIVRNIIIYLNPELIVFYRSEKQISYEQIIDAAVKGLPEYAVPHFEISEEYHNSIITGFISLINKYGYFKKSEDNQ